MKLSPTVQSELLGCSLAELTLLVQIPVGHTMLDHGIRDQLLKVAVAMGGISAGADAFQDNGDGTARLTGCARLGDIFHANNALRQACRDFHIVPRPLMFEWNPKQDAVAIQLVYAPTPSHPVDDMLRSLDGDNKITARVYKLQVINAYLLQCQPAGDQQPVAMGLDDNLVSHPISLLPDGNLLVQLPDLTLQPFLNLEAVIHAKLFLRVVPFLHGLTSQRDLCQSLLRTLEKLPPADFIQLYQQLEGTTLVPDRILHRQQYYAPKNATAP